MGIWQKLNPFARAEDKTNRYGSGKRSYAGAKVNRLTASWSVTPKPINYDIKTGLRALRARSREQAQNNDHVRGFLRMVKTNVIGHQGVAMQSRPPDLRGDGVDTLAAKAIEAAWEKWGKIGSADVTGKLSWRMIQRLYVECMARDGEVIVVFQKNKRNAAGFCLQFIDPELLDVELNNTLKNGNRVVMGVELDKFGAPVAYHFRQMTRPDADYYSFAGRDYLRVPAKDVIHDFITEDASQVRGVPWVASSLMRLNMLNGYEEAELVASRVSAAKMGFFEQDVDNAGNVYQGDGADADGNIVTDAEAGTFEVLPAGMKFNAWDPQHPNSAFAAFVKATLRGISAGLGVGYNSLANDLEGVNYSSLRQGALDERAVWMALQDHVIESFHERVFARWLSHALLAGISVGKGGTLRTTDLERYTVATWQPRRWQWVDPKKEMDGHETAMRCLVRSPQRVIMEQGDDPDDVLADWDAWFKKLDAIGIPKELALAVFTGGAGGGLPDPMAETAASEN